MLHAGKTSDRPHRETARWSVKQATQAIISTRSKRQVAEENEAGATLASLAATQPSSQGGGKAARLSIVQRAAGHAQKKALAESALDPSVQFVPETNVQL